MKGIYTLVGMKFRGAESYVRSLKPGTVIALERESTNRHDPNAVKVFVGDRFVAYVKATEARGLAVSMDGRGVKLVYGRFAVSPDGWPAVEMDE